MFVTILPCRARKCKRFLSFFKNEIIHLASAYSKEICAIYGKHFLERSFAALRAAQDDKFLSFLVILSGAPAGVQAKELPA